MAIKTGFFTPNVATEVEKIKAPDEIKSYLSSIVTEYVAQHPKVKPENVNKIRTDLERANSRNELIKLVWSYLLAHPSEGLRVIR